MKIRNPFLPNTYKFLSLVANFGANKLTPAKTSKLTKRPGYNGSSPLGNRNFQATFTNGPSNAAATPACGVTRSGKNIAPNSGNKTVHPRNPIAMKLQLRIRLPALPLTKTNAARHSPTMTDLCNNNAS